ncbi:hypothetical protein GCM10010446_36760 [Streptomyces enissocaesilis]|uniref:Uncharacterized protein n=1 Tax=Streptomyces enissocaesilis TaxID=332589 RepID=A0ABP6JU88_9ACTN
METAVDAGDTTGTYEVVAGRAGRRGETAVHGGVAEVSEVTLPRGLKGMEAPPPVP